MRYLLVADLSSDPARDRQSLRPISLGAGLRAEQLCFAHLVSIASDRLFAHEDPARRGQLLDLHPVELDVVTGLGGADHEG